LWIYSFEPMLDVHGSLMGADNREQLTEQLPRWAQPHVKEHWSGTRRSFLIEGYGWPRIAAYSVTTPLAPKDRLAPDDIVIGSRLVQRPQFKAPYAAVLPAHVIWPGFLVDMAFWGGAAFIVWGAPGLVRRGVRRGRGRCVGCGYELKDLSTCPECGSGFVARGSPQ
jgi:hypothetical protein